MQVTIYNYQNSCIYITETFDHPRFKYLSNTFKYLKTVSMQIAGSVRVTNTE